MEKMGSTAMDISAQENERTRKYRREEFEQSESIERHVLCKLRSAYETLQDVQSLLDSNEDLLERTSSFLTCEDVIDDGNGFCDFTNGESTLEAAMRRIYHVGGMLYAKRNVPPPEGQDDLTDEQMEEYMVEQEIEYFLQWLDEGHPPHICNESQAEPDKVEGSEAPSSEEAELAEQLQGNHDNRVGYILRAVGTLDACMGNLTDVQREEVIEALMKMQGHSPTARRLMGKTDLSVEEAIAQLN